MTAIRFQVEPRDVPPEKAARRMGLTLDRFTEILPRLLSRGFPASDPDTGNYDLDAVDAWRAARHGRAAHLPVAGVRSHDVDVVARRLEAMGA